MKDWSTFKSSVLHLQDSRIHKITNSIGVYDIYKMIRKNKWSGIGQRLTEHQFYTIIRQINSLLAEELIRGNDVKFPYRLGRLEVRKYKAKITFDGKKIKTNLPINWDRTLKLWYEDEESYKNKTTVKMEEQEIFKIYYNRNIGNFTNKSFMSFNVNREIKKKLKDSIKQGNTDAYELGRVTI